MVAEGLEKILTELGLTPEEFGVRIDMGKSSVYKLLRGDTKKITVATANKITEVFPQYTTSFLLSLNKKTLLDTDLDIGVPNGIENPLINSEEKIGRIIKVLNKNHDILMEKSEIYKVFSKMVAEDNGIREKRDKIKDMLK